MKRIVVFGESTSEVSNSYRTLIDKHRVIAYVAEEGTPEQTLLDAIFRASPPLTVHYTIKPKRIAKADMYFVDYLNGACFNILKRLPKDKSFLVASKFGLIDNPRDNKIKQQAEKEGHNIVAEYAIDELVEKLADEQSRERK